MPTYTFLNKNGVEVNFTTEEPASQEALRQFRIEAQGRSLSEYAMETLGNVDDSAQRLLSESADALIHWPRTLTGVAQALAGLTQSAMQVAGIDVGSEYIDNWQVIKEHYKDRYGSEQAIKDAFREDPLGVIADTALVLNPVSSGAKLAAGAGKAKVLASGLDKAAQAASLADPMALLAVGGTVGYNAAVTVIPKAGAGLFKLGTYYKFSQADNPVSHRGQSYTDLYPIKSKLVMDYKINPTEAGLARQQELKQQFINEQKTILEASSPTLPVITKTDLRKPLLAKRKELERYKTKDVDRAAKIKAIDQELANIDEFFLEGGIEKINWDSFAQGNPFSTYIEPIDTAALNLKDALRYRQMLDERRYGASYGPTNIGKGQMADTAPDAFTMSLLNEMTGTLRGKIRETNPALQEVTEKISDMLLIENDIKGAATRQRVAESGAKPLIIGGSVATAAMLGLNPYTTFGNAAGSSAALGVGAAFAARQQIGGPGVAGPFSRYIATKARNAPENRLSVGRAVNASRVITPAAVTLRAPERAGQTITQKIDSMMEEILRNF